MATVNPFNREQLAPIADVRKMQLEKMGEKLSEAINAFSVPFRTQRIQGTMEEMEAYFYAKRAYTSKIQSMLRMIEHELYPSQNRENID